MKPHNVQKLIDEARKGNIKAREELIKRYLDIVSNGVENYSGPLEKSDLYQEAVVVLILKINKYLKEDFSSTLGTYLNNAFQRFFAHTTNRMLKDYNKVKEGDFYTLKDSEELEELIDSIEEDKLSI